MMRPKGGKKKRKRKEKEETTCQRKSSHCVLEFQSLRGTAAQHDGVNG